MNGYDLDIDTIVARFQTSFWFEQKRWFVTVKSIDYGDNRGVRVLCSSERPETDVFYDRNPVVTLRTTFPTMSNNAVEINNS